MRYVVGKSRQMTNRTARHILAKLEEANMSIVEKLKGLNLDRMEFAEAVELYAGAGLIESALNALVRHTRTDGSNLAHRGNEDLVRDTGGPPACHAPDCLIF